MKTLYKFENALRGAISSTNRMLLLLEEKNLFYNNKIQVIQLALRLECRRGNSSMRDVNRSFKEVQNQLLNLKFAHKQFEEIVFNFFNAYKMALNREGSFGECFYT